MSFPHWQYFIAIESDLENTARYVEVAEDNFGTYSVEYSRILLSASSEIDPKCPCVRMSWHTTGTQNPFGYAHVR